MLIFMRVSFWLGLVGIGMGLKRKEDYAAQGLMMVVLNVIFLLLACNDMVMGN